MAFIASIGRRNSLIAPNRALGNHPFIPEQYSLCKPSNMRGTVVRCDPVSEIYGMSRAQFVVVDVIIACGNVTK